MKTKQAKRALIYTLVICAVLTSCGLALAGLDRLPPSAIPWMFFCGICLTPLAVGFGSFTLLNNFSKTIPRIDVTKYPEVTFADGEKRNHLVIDLSQVSQDKNRALNNTDEGPEL